MSYPDKQSPEAWARDLDFAGLERQHGLPAGVLTNLVRQESRGNCAATSPVGAQGICQFMPATARQLGVNARDPKSSAEGAAKYLEQLMDMFDGDPAKAIAAYNCGPGNVRKAMSSGGSDWRAHLPAETKNYLAIVGKDIGESYVQRDADGSLTDADRQAERARRERELNEAGIKLPGDSDILGALFFMIIKSFLENKLGNIGGSGPNIVAPQSVSPADSLTPPATPASPAVPAAAPVLSAPATNATPSPAPQSVSPADHQVPLPTPTVPAAPVRTPAAATR